MSGQASHSIPIYKVASPVVQSTGNGTSTTTTTVTVTSSTSTTPRMLLPAVLIPGKDGSGPSFAQFIPAAGASKNIQQGSSSTNIQPFIISGMPAGTSHHQASSSMLGLLTPVLPPDKSHKSKTIMHTTKLNSSQAATVVHAVLPQKQKIKFFSTKGPLTATSIMDESKKKSISSPPPLQPISAQHQIISLNKLKHLGGLNQFKRIQPYPTPAVEPSPSTSNDQSVLRVQIKQGNFGEFRSYAGKLKDSPEKEKKIFKEKSPAAIAKEAMAKIKDNDSMLTGTVNEFPGLIAIPVHPGLTPQRPSTSISETITIHSLASQKSTAEIPLSPEAITLHPLATQKSAPESLLKTETITLRPIAPKKSVSESVLKTETITLVPIATPSAGCDSPLQNEAFTIHPLTIQKKPPGSLLKTETIKLCNTSVIEEPISEPLLDNEALSLHPLETQLSGADFQSEDITILPITQKLVPECSLQSETITLHPLTAPNTLPDILMENETIIQSPSPPQENSDKIIQRDTAKASTCELNATTVNDIKSENDLEQNSKVINEEMPILPSTPTPIPVTVPEIPPVLSPSVEKPKEETPVPETPQVEDTKNPAEIEKEDTKATDATDKPSEETDSNKSEEEFNYKKMRQFKRPSILGGRKKFFDHGSPILASTLKKTAIAAFTKTSDTPETKKETLEVKKETPEVKKEENEDKKESSEAVEEKPQNASSEVKPPVIEEKVAEDFDPTKVLDWQDGVGVLPGSNLKFKMNEFGIMEMVEMEEDSKDAEPQKSESLPIKTEVKCEETQEEKKPPVPEVRKRARKEKLSPDDIYCCENCGCYGMACEFKTQRFCSDTCEEATSKRRAAIGRRAMELEELKQKRRKKRQLDVHGKPKTAQESGDDTASSTPEVPGMLPDSQDFVVNTPVTSATPGSTAQNSPSQTPAGSDEEANLSEGESSVPLLPWQVVNSNGEALFSWPKYLEHLKARAAPTKLFPDGGFPYQRNGFRPGMRLEGIDPRMPSQFCALSIADVKGYRIKLHFEGWPDTNDFWINADSRDIFAVAFCEKSGRSLVPPRGYPKTTFTWTPYLKLLKATAASRQLFLHRPTTKNAVGPSGFRVGMKLEAVDKQNQELICVATVADILDGRLLVHFDSWDHTYDYWVEPASPYIHPVGWCEQNKRTLTPPNGYTEFDWDNYLKETKSSAVPSRAFKPKSIAAFKKGMKLECVDPRFPELIRVSTVNDCRRHRIQISFDGWPLETAVWVDCDSPDIHPMGWCNKTGHLLTPPPGPNQEHYCITPGCRALLKNSQLILPHSCNSCPLSTVNLTNVNKVKKIPVKETIMAKPPVESSEGEDFKGDSDDDEDYIDEKPEPPPKKRKLDCNLKSLRLDVHESIFSPGYVPSPAELPLKWSKHAHLLNIENKKPLNNKVVKTWSPHQVQNFVSSLPGCEDNSKAFIDEKIDGESLLLLTQSDLISMLGFKVGPAIKLYSSITLLKNKKQEV